VGIALAATVVAVLCAEGICRLVLDPVDYLQPEVIPDDVLHFRIKPHSGGHDAWGFRNRAVPEHADIVAIGDSQTYGCAARSDESWPAQLGELTGRKVYNLSLGGYGPAQYFHLVRNWAVKLRPSLIVLGLYLGNDIAGATHYVYRDERLKQYRRPGFTGDVKSKYEREVPEWYGAFAALRRQLSQRSVVYGVVKYSGIGDFVRLAEFRRSGANRGGKLVAIEIEEHGVFTAFTPRTRLNALNLEDADVREGLRLTCELVHGMSELCRENGISFLVCLTPTKETVYGAYLRGERELPDHDISVALLANEREANETLTAFLGENRIPFLDLLARLREHADTTQLYPRNHDGHPNENGYRVIAEAVHERMGTLGL